MNKKSDISLTLLCLAAMVSCVEPVVTPPDPTPPTPVEVQLETPELTIDGNSAVWTAVEGALGYQTEVAGTEREQTAALKVDMAATYGKGEWNIRVRAVGNGVDLLNSEWSAAQTVAVTDYAPTPTMPPDYAAIAPHPRLFLRSNTIANIKQMLASSSGAYLCVVDEYIMNFADQMLTTAVLPTSSGANLSYARAALKRIFMLSYAYQMTGESKYAARCEKELAAICTYSDWNPSHFLDVGEMSMAAAIGYDWCYDYLSDESKANIEQAVYDKAYTASLTSGIRNSVNNWNPVCLAGLICSEIATYEAYPIIYKEQIEGNLLGNKTGMEYYGPDGGYTEGHTYWSYGTAFETMLLSAIEGAFSYDTGLSKATGFVRSATYRQMTVTPLYNAFSYSDAGTASLCCPTSAWFTALTGDASLMYVGKQMIERGYLEFDIEDRYLPMMLISASTVDLSKIAEPSERVWVSYGDTPVYIYRNGWTSTEDLYLGIKGGCAHTSHAHMDSGSFYYENRGVQWAADLGGQSYGPINDMLGDTGQNGQKWQIFRYSVKSHNTIWFGDNNQNVDARSKITEVFDDERHGCSIDLDETFAGQVASAKRSVWVDPEGNLHVTDRITTSAATKLHWNMTTSASAKIDNTDFSIVLTKNGKQMRLSCPKSTTAAPYIRSATTGNSYDVANTGYTCVGFDEPLSAGQTYELEFLLESI